MCAAAAIGALYGVLAVVFGLQGIFVYVSAAAVSVLMTMTAFGLPSGIISLLRESAVVWGSGALLGGIMTALLSVFGKADTPEGQSPTSGGLILGAGIIILYLTVKALTRKTSAKSVSLTIFYGGKSVSLTALCDSGNLLRDPISDCPVMNVCEKKLIPLLGEEVCGRMTSFSAGNGGDLPRGYRLIPRKTAVGSDICAAFMPDRIEIKNKKSTSVRCLITAVRCPEDFFGGFSASFPSNAIR